MDSMHRRSSTIARFFQFVKQLVFKAKTPTPEVDNFNPLVAAEKALQKGDWGAFPALIAKLAIAGSLPQCPTPKRRLIGQAVLVIADHLVKQNQILLGDAAYKQAERLLDSHAFRVIAQDRRKQLLRNIRQQASTNPQVIIEQKNNSEGYDPVVPINRRDACWPLSGAFRLEIPTLGSLQEFILKHSEYTIIGMRMPVQSRRRYSTARPSDYALG